MSALFRPLEVRGVVLRNRLGLSPMSQYSSPTGSPEQWHLVHYGSRAATLGLVMLEATAVSRDARVTPFDLCIDTDAVTSQFAQLAAFITSQGSVPGIQLSHGGRKSSRSTPAEGDQWLKSSDGGWRVVGPSPLAFGAGYAIPEELSADAIGQIKVDFRDAAVRSAAAGYKLIELHAGHGRLLHSFYSPVSNQRADEYGGSHERRIRLLVETAEGVRRSIHQDIALVVRLSCVDWVAGGWDLDDSVALSAALREVGVDMIDCSSGGIVRPIAKATSPGYQVPFARAIRKRAGIATAAVGLISQYELATATVEQADADVVLLGRSLLAHPGPAFGFAARAGQLSRLIPPSYDRGMRSLSNESEYTPEL